MNDKRQATLDALAKIPNGIWPAYLMTLRGLNLAVGNMLLDDPTPCVELEDAIKVELEVQGEKR